MTTLYLLLPLGLFAGGTALFVGVAFWLYVNLRAPINVLAASILVLAAVFCGSLFWSVFEISATYWWGW